MMETVKAFLNARVPDCYKIQYEKIEQIMPVEYAFRSDSSKFKPIKKLSGEIAHVFTYIQNSDLTIMPKSIKEASMYDIRIQMLAYWIRLNVFDYMYSHVNPVDTNTTDVRIRIAINHINKLQSLPNDAKLMWINWLCELYKVRLKAVMDYYLIKIVQLPFQLGLRSLS